jgi:hypothetical protein
MTLAPSDLRRKVGECRTILDKSGTRLYLNTTNSGASRCYIPCSFKRSEILLQCAQRSIAPVTIASILGASKYGSSLHSSLCNPNSCSSVSLSIQRNPHSVLPALGRSLTILLTLSSHTHLPLSSPSPSRPPNPPKFTTSGTLPLRHITHTTSFSPSFTS